MTRFAPVLILGLSVMTGCASDRTGTVAVKDVESGVGLAAR